MCEIRTPNFWTISKPLESISDEVYLWLVNLAQQWKIGVLCSIERLKLFLFEQTISIIENDYCIHPIFGAKPIKLQTMLQISLYSISS